MMEKNHSFRSSGLLESLLCILAGVYLVCLFLATAVSAFSIHDGEPVRIFTRLQWFQALGSVAAALTIVAAIIFLFYSCSKKKGPAN